jgi:DNA polymerase-4
MKDRITLNGSEQEWDRSARVIAHIDMDAFFASVEALDNPELSGKPVIVGGTSERGVVSAASYEARKFGVHSAMPMFQARKLCTAGIFLPVRMKRYRQISRGIMECLMSFSPLVEQVSVDEAFVDLTGTGELFGEPWEVAGKIKDSIRGQTSLSCSIGVSTCKFLAKVASEVSKPDGLTIVAPHQVEEFLSHLPIGKVPGVGERSVKELSKVGIKYVGDIKRHAPQWLMERFGKFGSRLIKISKGRDDSAVVPYIEPKSVSAETTLQEDTADIKVLARYLMGQAERVGRSLRKKGLAGRTVTLKLKDSAFRQITRSRTMSRPTQITEVIFREAEKILRGYNPRNKIRLIGVGVSNLESGEVGGQMNLFDDTGAMEERWRNVDQAMDRITNQYGREALRRGRTYED